ncbi:MAG: flippase activity-associated protein Agl23, partial [Chloroflexota bacterium]
MATAEAVAEGTRGRVERLLSEGVRLDAEKLVYVAVIVLALITRFYGLGQRVMSHDETTHVYYSWNLFRGLGFRHDPLMHGPLQFHLWALSYFLFGVNDATARLPDAVMGVIAVGLMWAFRRWLGKVGALVAAGLMLVSPYMLYYSRYAREDAFAIVAGLLMMWAVLSYMDTRQSRWLYLLAASLALHFAIKETSYIYSAELLLFLGIWFVWQVLHRPWDRRRDKVLFLGGMIVAAAGTAAALAFFMRDVVGATLALKEERELITSPLNGMVSLLGLLLAGLGAIIVVAALISSFGGRLRTEFPSLDLLVVSGSMIITQLSAVFLPVQTIASYGQTDNPQTLVGPEAIQRLWLGLPLLLLIAAAAGLAWDWRRWLTAAGVFAAIYVTFYTTLFTHAMGLATGAIGSLAYWLGQQGVSRGSQPWYYYLALQIPVYEFLPAIGAIIAAGIGLVGRKRQRVSDTPATTGPVAGATRVDPRLPLVFLGYWAVASLLAFSYAGEKMPWLTVHVALPLILVAGWGIGRLLESVDWRGLWVRRGWLVAALLLLFLLAAARTLGYLLGPTPPFQGVLLEELDVTLGFLTSLGVAVAAAIALFVVGRGW